MNTRNEIQHPILSIFAIIVILVITLIIWTILSESYHAKYSKKVDVKIEIKTIIGEKETLIYKLPYDYNLSIGSSKGSYYLQYCQDSTPILSGTHWRILKYGVLDYKVIK